MRILVVLGLLVAGTVGTVSRLGAQQQYLFTRLGTRDGLASNSILSLAQDAKGYIWIGTSNGLQRYDGYRMLLFQHRNNDIHSLPNNVVIQLETDKVNRLWVRSEFNRVGYVDLSNLQYHEVPVIYPEEERNKSDAHLFIDRVGHVMLFLYNRATLTYDPGTGTMRKENRPFEMPPGWKPVTFNEDRDGSYWLGSDSGLVRYDPVRHSLAWRGHNPDHDSVIANYGHYTHLYFPYRDRSGRFWCMRWPPTDGWGPSYLSFDPATGKEFNWGANIGGLVQGKYTEMKQLGETSDGTVLLIGVRMLMVLRPGSKRFDLLGPNAGGEFGINYDVVQNWIEDREHNIWLATDRGLYWYNPGAQVFHAVPNRLAGSDSARNAEVTSIQQLRGGDILVSTWGEGHFAYDSLFRPVKRWYIDQVRKASVFENLAWCTVERPNGDIWYGQQLGWLLISHAATHKTEAKLLPVFGKSTIRQMVQDKEGNIWLATQKGDVVRWDARTEAFSLMTTTKGAIQRLYMDHEGDIWAGTEKDGVYHISHHDGSILHHYMRTDSAGFQLSGIGVADIVQYSDSLFLLASHNIDLLDIRTGRIRSDTTRNGALFSGPTNLIRDRRGYVWITNAEGLHKLNFQTQQAASFFEMDGVGNNAFEPGATTTLPDGRIVIGTAHDLLVFQPAQVKAAQAPPNDIEITGIWMQNNPLAVDSIERQGVLELPTSNTSLRITFSTLAYQDVGGIRHHLDGLDKDWTEARSNEAVYNYLPPGRYTFQVRGINAENLESRHIRELVIKVDGPFWRTWWFLCLVLLAGAVLLYLLDRLRMQRKAGFEKMRSDISGNLHGEVNKALQNINVLSEIARIKAEKDPEQSINYINEIHHKSSTMINTMDDMLWAIDPANDRMGNAVDRMREFAEALERRHGVRVHVQTEAGVERLRPDMNVRHELLLIYKIVLRVLIEEAGAPETLVSLDLEHGKLNLSITSPGIRIDPRNGKSIRLIEEARQRAAAIHGVFDFETDEKMTAVLLTCPSTF